MKKFYLLFILFASIITWTTLEAATLTNNYSQPTGTITFYPSGQYVTKLNAWESTTIPAGTTGMILSGLTNGGEYSITGGSSDLNIYSNFVYTNNTALNVYVNSYKSGQTYPSGGCGLSAGESLPFVTGTNIINVLYNNSTILSTNVSSSSNSYIINHNGYWSLTAYNPTLSNNYTQPANSINFYNSNPNTTAPLSTTSLVAWSGTGTYPVTNIPSTTTFATLNTTFNGANSTLTIPAIFPYENIFGTGTMTNNTLSSVTVTYYGTVNGNTTALNNSVITILPQGNIPNITGCSSINVFSATGASLVNQAPITANISYFINSDGTVGTTANNILYNNSNTQITDAIVYSSANILLTSTATNISAWTSIELPSIAVSPGNDITFKYAYPNNPSLTFTLPISITPSANIFSPYILTNNTSSTVTVDILTNLNNGQTNIPISSAPVSTKFYNITSVSMNVQPLISGVAYGDPITIAYTGGTQVATTNYGTITVFTDNPSDVSYTVTLPVYPNAAPVTVPYNPIYPGGYQVTTDAINIYVGGLTTPATSTPVYVCQPITLLAGQSIQLMQGSASINVTSGSTTINSPLVTSGSTIPNLSYIINDDGGLSINSYTPTLTNNYSQDATNVNYYNSNPAGGFISSPGTITAESFADIPGSSTYATLTELGSTLTIPMAFPLQNIFTGSSITNSSGQTITITYTGTVNGSATTPINSTPISLAPGAVSPIVTGALNISAVDSSGRAITNITNYQIQSGMPYYITYTNGIWYISSNATLAQLLNNSGNNSSSPATNVTFYDTFGVQIYQTIASLPAGGSASIPTGAVSCNFTTIFNGASVNLTVSVSDVVSSNIFGSGILTNTSGVSTVTVNYTGTVNGHSGTSLNTAPITLTNTQFIPIVNGTFIINVYSPSYPTLVISKSSIASSISYFINDAGGWSIDTSAITIKLLNNYTSAGTNFTLKNSSGTPIFGPTTLSAGAYTQIISDAITATMTCVIPTYGTSTTIYTPVSDTINSNVFAGSITNNAQGTVSVTYYGTINGLPATLNTTPIVIPLTSPGPKIPIITGATSVTVYSNGVAIPTLTGVLITDTLNYYINDDTVNGVEEWNLDTFAATCILTNNSNQTISAITFKDHSGTTITTSAQVTGWGHTQIPITATTATFSYTFNSVTSLFTIPVSGATSSNVFENYVLTNNCTSAINVTCYGTINTVVSTALNTTAIPIPVGGSIQIITNTTNISATSTGGALPTSAITSTLSYQITNGSGTLVIASYVPMFINNGQQNASNLTFLQSDGAAITPLYPTFNIAASVPIPGNAAFATLTDLTSTLTVATPFAVISNLFDSNTITNNSQQTIAVNFYGSVNGQTDQLLNSPSISIQASKSLQIISGCSSFEIMAGSNQAVATQDPVDTHTPYFINEDIVDGIDTWTITNSIPLSGATLTNNYNATGTNLAFYSAIDTQIDGTQATVPAYTPPVFIPINATYATITELSSNLITPVSDTLASTIFTGFVINNNSTEIINLSFYGTINGTEDTLLNNPAFITNCSASAPVITGATAVTVTVNNIVVISLESGAISSTSSYYVNNINGIWTLTESIPSSVVSITNNYSLDATNFIFYDLNGIALSGAPSFPAYSKMPMPLTTTSATFIDFTTVEFNVPIASDTTPSNLFTNYVITNNSDQTIGIVYNGTVNSVTDIQLNNPSIPCLDSLNSPLLTGADTFSIYDNGGILRVNQQSIAINTSYTINDDWTVTAVTGTVNLTNNFTTATNLMFLNSVDVQVGTTIPTFGAGSPQAIPSTAVKATLVDTLNGTDSVTITIPVSDTVSSNIFTNNVSENEPYTITNNSTASIEIIVYGTVNGAPGVALTPAVSILSSLSIPIITGTTTVSIIVSGTTQISHAVISPNTNYYVNNSDDVWTINTYASVATLTNNYTSDATALIFYNSSTPITTAASFPSLSSKPMPTTATKATMTDFGVTLTIPIVNNSSNSTVFCPTAIANNSGVTINITLYGVLNDGSPVTLNSAPLTKTNGASMQIITGTTNVSVAESGGQINHVSIDPTLSYYISLIDGTWSITAYTTDAILTNNYNVSGANLNFYSAAAPTTPLPLIQPTAFEAFGIAGIPSTSTVASFDDIFNSISSTLTFPVVDNISSNVFVPYVIYNKTLFTITVVYYGTVNGTTDTALNTPLSIAPGGSIPILTATQYLKVYYPTSPTVVIDTSGMTLPLIVSYDINYNSGTWSITPEIFTLTNNSNQIVNVINFYNSAGSLVSSAYSTIQPWATIPIPATAVLAIAQYDSCTISVSLSTQTSSKIFTNSLLINNSNDTVFAIFYGTLYGVQNSPLNDIAIQLQAGQSIPIITSTLNVSVLLDDNFTFISNAPITSTKSYEIGKGVGYSLATRAIASTIEQSSSALGVLRFLGGSVVEQPSIPSVNLYAENYQLFDEFLYVSLYLQIISDSAARSATSIAVNAVINTYATDYSNQSNFNYITNAYLMNPNLLAAQQTITRLYSASATQITKFFILLQKRIAALSA
jgi:hypothetical protein